MTGIWRGIYVETKVITVDANSIANTTVSYEGFEEIPYVFAAPRLYINPDKIELIILNVSKNTIEIRVQNNHTSSLDIPVQLLCIGKI